jgi:ribosomal protein S18 acetylase RimI-like enzyme
MKNVIRTVSLDEALARRVELAEIWGDVTAEDLKRLLPRHAARDGFRFFVAEAASRLAGFGYGHVGADGQWWHDCVAAAMAPEQRARWLGPGHFEFVELHLRTELRRRGIGGALHDAIAHGLDGRSIVASIRADNDPALALAAARGYAVIVAEVHFSPGDAPYCIVGRGALHEGSPR